MGGSGGGYSPSNITPEEIKENYDETIEALNESNTISEVNDKLNKQLPDINERNVDLTNQRIDKVKKVLGDKIEDTINSCFGGSVDKHTYVNGLSDIDCLLLIEDTELEEKLPKQVLDFIKHSIEQNKKSLSDISTVNSGKMAVTVKFTDDMEIQFLPGLKSGDKYQIPSSSGKDWSKIDPQKFSKALTEANQKQNGKLIPTIKLAKVALSKLPEDMRPDGHHVESMAVKAFKDYNGSKDPLSMAKHFFSEMPGFVLEPIKDKTDQSMYIDSYLGEENSTKRKNMSHMINRIHRRIRNAIYNESKEQLLELFNVNDESTR